MIFRIALCSLLLVLPAVALPISEAEDETAITETATSETSDSTPDQVVTDLYAAQNPDSNLFGQTDDRAALDPYFDQPLADLIWKNAKEADGEVGALEADPLYDAQDTDIKAFKVTLVETKGKKAKVTVSFRNFNEPQKFTFLLVHNEGGWRISDIQYTAKRTLVGMLKGG